MVEQKLSVEEMRAHIDALPILIDYIKERMRTGDEERASNVLWRWDEARAKVKKVT